MVGDLHGCYSLLMQELQNIHFDFQNDVLICTGDLVDRGAENLVCISLLDEAWFYTVRGNHEEMCIKSAHDPKIKEIHARNGGEWFYQLSQIQRLEIIERFKQLPLVIEVQLKNKKIGVVHPLNLANLLLNIQSPLFCISHSLFQPKHYRMNHQLYRLTLVNLLLLDDWYSEWKDIAHLYRNDELHSLAYLDYAKLVLMHQAPYLYSYVLILSIQQLLVKTHQ